jgi:hypothetical protein
MLTFMAPIIVRIILGCFALVPWLAPAADWKYQVLAEGRVVKADTIRANATNTLAEFEAVKVEGFRTARLYFRLLQSDFAKNFGKFPENSRVRITCGHVLKSGPSPYFYGEFRNKYSTYIDGWIEIPILGPSLGLTISGENVPRVDMEIDCTIYLVE